MVLAKAAIDAFLKRKLRNSSKAKRFTDRALDEMLRNKGLEFLTDPRYAQKVCVLLGWKHPAYLFLLGMGAGKTKICLDLFRNRKRTGEVKRCLVLVPNVVNLVAWEEEVEIHAKDCTVRGMDMSGAEARLSLLQSTYEIVIATYQGLSSLASKTVASSRKKKNVWKPDDKACRDIAKQFDMLVLDECTAIKNHQSLPFRIIKKMSREIEYRYGLTGTPFDKDPQDLWSQFFAIDSGWSLGETLGLFREAFFTTKKGYFGVYEYSFMSKMLPVLNRRLTHCAVRFREEECQDLPKAIGGINGVRWMERTVEMPAAARKYYDKIRQDAAESMGDWEVIDNAYTRMRMLSSGWLGAKTESGEKVEIVLPGNPKLDALLELLDEIPQSEKVIVIHWFNATGAKIHEAFKKKKVKHVWVYGKTSPNDKRAAIQQFKKSSGPRVLLASTAISKGVNLQAAARFMVFLESPDSVLERKQMEARILREGGLSGARRYYDLCCRNTVDQKILKALREGRRFLDLVVDGKETL